jgi:hypothetical protein
MSKLVVMIIPILFFQTLAYAQVWKVDKGDHFIVYYVENEASARQVVRKAEYYYDKIASDLGYPRYSNFWQWDKRVKIYLHASPEEFQKATGQPSWSHGMASYLDKTIHAFNADEPFLNSVLPHEITHLIFRDFVGFEGQVPLWMDEGVAQWEETGKRDHAKKFAKELVSRENVFNVRQLTRMDIRKETNAGKVHLFYVQAVLLVDFLIAQYGASQFTAFCRGLRDGKTLDEALSSAYTGSIQSVDELDARWRSYALQ